MEWDEPVAEAEDEEGFAGSLGQYVGQTLEVNRWREDAYELRYEDDVVGRLTRPGELMLAQTREGSWELRHSPTVSRMQAVDAATGATVATYKRAFLQQGGRIRVPPSSSYRLRHDVRRWTLTQSRSGVLAFIASRDGLAVSVEVVRDTGTQELGLLALMCSYVILLNRASARASLIDGSGAAG